MTQALWVLCLLLLYLCYTSCFPDNWNNTIFYL